jgi:hypothetical protein
MSQMGKIIRRRMEEFRDSVPPSAAKIGYMTEKLQLLSCRNPRNQFPRG